MTTTFPTTADLSPAVLKPPHPHGQHQGLRIEWQLCSSIIRGEHPLHFDGLLSSVAFHQARAAGLDPWPARFDLPLLKGIADFGAAAPEAFVFAASQVFFVEPQGPAVSVAMTRRMNMAHTAKLIDKGLLVTGRRTVEVGTGPDKNVLVHVQAQLYRRAVAYCIGDPARIAMMLRRVHALGGERRLGFGQVLGFKVEPDDRASERWRWRALPVSMKGWADEWHFLAQGTVRPDYFSRSQWENCFEWQGIPPDDL